MYTAIITQEEFNDLINLFNEAVKVHGFFNDTDIKARNLINKFKPEELKNSEKL